MQTITAYKTKDGKLFTDFDEAEDHEYMLDNGLIFDNKELSKREKELTKLLIRTPLSNSEIAEVLNITERTVKAHTSNIYRKFGINSRIELIQAEMFSLDIKQK